MAIEKEPLYVAAASIVMGSGGALNFQNGCTIARTGVGTYLVTTDQPFALSSVIARRETYVAPGTGSASSLQQTTPSTWTIVTAASSGGSAADIAGVLVFDLVALGQGV